MKNRLLEIIKRQRKWQTARKIVGYSVDSLLKDEETLVQKLENVVEHFKEPPNVIITKYRIGQEVWFNKYVGQGKIDIISAEIFKIDICNAGQINYWLGDACLGTKREEYELYDTEAEAIAVLDTN